MTDLIVHGRNISRDLRGGGVVGAWRGLSLNAAGTKHTGMQHSSFIHSTLTHSTMTPKRSNVSNGDERLGCSRHIDGAAITICSPPSSPRTESYSLLQIPGKSVNGTLFRAPVLHCRLRIGWEPVAKAIKQAYFELAPRCLGALRKQTLDTDERRQAMGKPETYTLHYCCTFTSYVT